MIIPVTKTDLFDIANTATAPANNKHKPASISGLLAFCRSFMVFSYFLVNVINRKRFYHDRSVSTDSQFYNTTIHPKE